MMIGWGGKDFRWDGKWPGVIPPPKTSPLHAPGLKFKTFHNLD